MARVLIHIPEPNKHLLRFYGVYANRTRATYPAEYTVLAERYSSVSSIVDPLVNVGVDSNTRSPHTDLLHRYRAGIGADGSIGASYVRRSGSMFTGWNDVGGIYGREVIALPDGSPLEVFPLQNDPSERFFLLTNREDYYIRYRAFLLTDQKRWADRWQLLLSYSNSEATGLQSQNGQESMGMQGSVTTSFNPVGRDPNHLTNATGILPHLRGARRQ